MFILLDIDGVMVPARNWKRPEFEEDGFPKFSMKAIESLRKIIFETGAEILLTSSHKSTYKIGEWENIFSNRGIPDVTIKKLNKNNSHLSRKDEVMGWIEKGHSDDYVIIDDDKSLNGLPSNIKEKLVQTSATVGLNDELANLAISILKPSVEITT